MYVHKFTDSNALIVIDVQRDFFEGGITPIPDSLEIIPKINRLRQHFDLVVFSKDWHPENHCSFEKNGGLWVQHCVRGTDGAEIHSAIFVLDTDYIVTKGSKELQDTRSAFFNSEGEKTQLNSILLNRKIETVYVCGLAIDNCIYSTILDAIKLRFKCVFIEDASVGMNDDQVKKCKKQMKLFGVKFINSDQIKD